jgi:predicted nucleotidyltransferase
MREVEIPQLHCYRCGNTWTPRGRVVRICPRCKSRYWDEPKIRVPQGGGGLGVDEVLGPFRRAIGRIARRYHVREIRVFGSLARGAGGPESDVDFLVEFDRSVRTRSSLRSVDLALDLEKLLSRHVDVATESSLHWYIQPQVVAEAVPL